MGMTIEEIIKKEKEIAAEFQKVVDTHIVNDDGFTIEEMYCDDSEAINEQLSLCESLADYHKQIADVMSKYQKIQKIINGYDAAWELHHMKPTIDEIRKVVEDGKID